MTEASNHSELLKVTRQFRAWELIGSRRPPTLTCIEQVADRRFGR